MGWVRWGVRCERVKSSTQGHRHTETDHDELWSRGGGRVFGAIIVGERRQKWCDEWKGNNGEMHSKIYLLGGVVSVTGRA
jgi:hypothetical protein